MYGAVISTGFFLTETGSALVPVKCGHHKSAFTEVLLPLTRAGAWLKPQVMNASCYKVGYR